MAQKSQKTLAAKNTSTLNRTHLIALGVHTFYLLLTLLIFRTRKAPSPYPWLPYILCSTPALAIEIYFESLSRPTYKSNGTIQRAGEDLEAPGLTEWMWDVIYWTWACVVLVAVVGRWGWWAYGVVPGYTVYLLVGTWGKMKGGWMGQGSESGGTGGGALDGGQSKRQAKMEKRGGQQKVQYR